MKIERKGRRRIIVSGLILVTLGVLYQLFTGPRDYRLYPFSHSSPYKLPFLPGETNLCVQGNRGVVSHRGMQEFGYDFAMPVGSAVCAARAGRVIDVVDVYDGNGFTAPNNYVEILHDDQTIAHYAHIKQHGSYVKVGQVVKQGDMVAASGNVGRSMLPHLHFEVRDRQNRTIPVTFFDVDKDLGIPRMFSFYRSNNVVEKDPMTK